MTQVLWTPGSRELAREAIGHRDSPWDLIIAGGGITGAGVAREAARRGLSVLLVERQDFSWGTSSRSSKMVHGGLRYIAQGDIRTTMHSVHERERLMKEAPGLVDLMPYMMPHYRGRFPGPFAFGMLLRVYDLLARKRYRQFWNAERISARFPALRRKDLSGATEFADAVTDDSRLVMRVLHEARADGACVMNYMGVKAVSQGDELASVTLEDALTGEQIQVNARCVVNATGVWANQLREGQGGELQSIRPARGSHIVVDRARLSVDVSFTVIHPRDQRPIFVYPWEGRTVIGTTDLDTPMPGNEEIGITLAEVDYLFELVEFQFPGTALTRRDIISSWAGIRPLVSSGAKSSSGEKRDHSVWKDGRLVSVSGGKLTTFRLIANDVMRAAAEWLPDNDGSDRNARVFSAVTVSNPQPRRVNDDDWRRLCGFYGNDAADVLAQADDEDLEPVPGSQIFWAELRWAAAGEAIVHLDDLLLRRTRLGLLVPQGGMTHEKRLRTLLQPVLGWSDHRWQEETERYRRLWETYYWLPES